MRIPLRVVIPFLLLIEFPAASPARIAFTRIPLAFEPSGDGNLVGRQGPYTLAVEPGRTILTISNRRSRRSSSVITTLAGARAQSRIEGTDPLSAKANYLVGGDPRQWRTNVPRFARAVDSDVYPGIDLVFHGSGRTLEYDFVVRPGADPRRIALSISGASRIRLTPGGDLVLATPAGDALWDKPEVFQWNGSRRETITGAFALRGRTITFTLGSYDRSRPLIIDPTLSYSSFLGGSDDEGSRAIAVDSAGNFYIAGFTFSNNLPHTGGSLQASYHGGSLSSQLGGDAFVAKFSATGALAYVTYLGGKSNDVATAIAVDSGGNAYITGYTTSGDFPTTPGALATIFSGGQGGQNNDGAGGDAFVAKLNPAGSALVYSTFLGGTLDEEGLAIAVDGTGAAYVGGATLSHNFPTTANAFQPAFAGSGGMPNLPCGACGPLMDEGDGFIAKLNPAGSGLVYSTYLGGHLDDAVTSLAIDSSGNVYAGGFTLSNDFPVLLGYQMKSGGVPSDSVQPEVKFGDGFVTKLDSTGKPVYSTYLGGVADDAIMGLAVDSAGAVYVTGFTSSANFPVTSGAPQGTLHGPTGILNGKDSVWGDAFVAKLAPAGNALVYSTFLGGSDDDAGMAIAVNAAGEAFVVGFSNSTNFPVSADGIQKGMAGSGLGGYTDPTGDGFLTKLSADGANFAYSSYFGGSKDDAATAVALDSQGKVYMAGSTTSANITITSGAAQPTFGGLALPSETMGDAFVAVFSGFTSGGTGPSGNGPVITSVVNGASFVPGVVANAWLTIKGSNFAAVTDDWSNSVIVGVLPTTLDGVTVTVSGQKAYVEAISPGQINVVAPDVPPGPTQVVVSTAGGTSSPFSSTVQIYGPAFFLWPGGYAVATHTDFTPAVKPGTFPAMTVSSKPGETIILWGSGFGPTTPAMPVGVALPADTIYKAANLPTVTIGGVQAQVFGAALGSGFASAYLVAVQVPPTIGSGDYPVVATVNGVQSPATTLLTVQQ